MNDYFSEIERQLKRRFELQRSYLFESTHYMWMYCATGDEKYLEGEKKILHPISYV